MVLKPCVALAALLVATVSAQISAGGENYGIPFAQPTIPFDKCSIAAANDPDMKLSAVAWGYNNEYWLVQQGDDWGPFGEWKSLGGFFASGPTVIRNANNELVVFGLSVVNSTEPGSKQVLYKVVHGDNSQWISLGGKVLSGRVTAILDAQGLIHLFVIGGNSGAWEKRQYANGDEAVWGEWTSLGGLFSSDVAAVGDAEGIIHLFARGLDGFLWYTTQKLEIDGSLTWVAWNKAADSILLSSSAKIVAQLNAQNLVEVIVRGADKGFWHIRQVVGSTGIEWSPFKALDENARSHAAAPALHINSDSLLTTFSLGAEKGIWYKQQAHHPVESKDDAWSKWIPLGGIFSAGADVVADSRGYLNVFSRGVDRAIWTRGQLYSTASKSVGFFEGWQSLKGRFRAFAC